MTVTEEQHAIELFLKLSGMQGSVRKTESPDFILDTPNGKIGVEFTEVVNQAASNSQHLPAKWYTFEDRIMDKAKQIFEQRTDIKVFVTVDFNKYIPINYRRIDVIANSLVDFLIKELESHDKSKQQFHLELDREQISEYFNIVSFDIVPNFDFMQWSAIRSKFTEDLTTAEINYAVKKKDRLLRKYKEQANTVYLIIVEGFGPKSWYYRFQGDTMSIETGFDNVFLLRMMAQELIRLK